MGLVEFIYKLREKRRLNAKQVPREVTLHVSDHKITKNGIQTAKYNWLTFLPLNLLEQATQLSNIYYAIISIMSAIPDISITDGNPVLAYALVVVVIFTMLKDLYEDRKRQVLDKRENNRIVRVFEHGKWHEKKNKDIQVATVIQVMENESIPADILLIDSSNVAGICFIETANLDGEANLKTKLLKRELKQAMNCEKEFEGAEPISFTYMHPNQYIYKFEGKARLHDGKEIPLEYENFIPRGTVLKNTAWIKGMVVYTGNETKIMLNSIHAKSKHSGIERSTNSRVLLLFVIQIVISLVAAIVAATWMDWNASKHVYLRVSSSNSYTYNFFVTFGTWNLLIAQVPISIIIHLEIVRIFQAIKVIKDPRMKTKTGVEASVQNSADIEDLGQANIIFSDKTGTLTKNEMHFRMISIGGVLYGGNNIEGKPQNPSVQELNTSKLVIVHKGENQPEEHKQQDEARNQNADPSSGEVNKVPFVDFEDRNFMSLIINENAPEHKNVIEALNCLALCHTIVRDENGHYNATSSDELALVNFAKFGGYEFMGTSKEDIHTWFLQTPKGMVEYKLLRLFEFNSDKKRMTVVLLNKATNEICLICKGAEESIMRLIKKDDPTLIEKTYSHVIESSKLGFRTLVYCMKKLTESEYNEWNKKYQAAELLTGEEKKTALFTLETELETNSSVIGATIIEDKLQDEVKETLEFLRSAGIKVWMITGDNIETAMNISRSCGLVGHDVQFERFDETDKLALITHVNRYIKTFESNQLNKLAVIMSGAALEYIHDPDIPQNDLFRKFAQAQAVVYCRVSPKQKGEIIVHYRKAKPTAVTLGIGDGVNDVAMLVTAHVGVGIKGFESQAARVAEFAIGEFRFLKNLMCVHGREAYRRNSTLLSYVIYRNMIICGPVIYYGFLSTFSGTPMYDAVMISLYQLVYATLPVTVYAIWDREFCDASFLNEQSLYKTGRDNTLYNIKEFSLWLINPLIQGVWNFYLIVYGLDSSFVTSDGHTNTFWVTAQASFWMVVIVCNIKEAVVAFSINFLFILSMLFGIVFFIAYFAYLSSYTDYDLYYCFEFMFSTPNFYWATFLIFVMSIFADVACRNMRYLSMPNYVELRKKDKQLRKEKKNC